MAAGFRRGDVFVDVSGRELGVLFCRSLRYMNFTGGHNLRHDYCKCFAAHRTVEVWPRKKVKGSGTSGYKVADEIGHFPTHEDAVRALLDACVTENSCAEPKADIAAEYRLK